MDIKAFDSLISDFKSMADTTRSDLTNVIDMLSEGKVPSDELRQRIDESLGDLQNKYGNIYAELQKYATNVECPNSKAGVDFFAETFKRSEELRIREELEKAKAVIEKFLRVTSSVDSYLEALKPYQNNAQQLLDDIIAKKVNDEIDDKIQSEKVFLQILEERFDDSDEDTLYDILGEHYSKKIERGLALKRYFIGGETTGPETKRETAPEQVTEIKEDVPETKPQNTNVAGPNYVTAKGKVKTGKSNATAFIKDINGSNARNPFEKNAANFSRNILALGIRFGVISHELVEQDVLVTSSSKKRMQADKSTVVALIESALHDLKKKGYILEYELPSLKEPVYCLSPLTEACLKKKTVQDLFPDVDWSKYIGIIGGYQVPEDILKRIYQSNLLLFKYLSSKPGLWYGDKDLNLERSFKALTSSDDGEIQITGREIFDRINLSVDEKKTVRCIIDNGYLPENLPENESIFVIDRNHESAHSGRTVYYFDEIVAKKTAAENPEETVKSGGSKEIETSSSASDKEASASDTSKLVSTKKENAERDESEPQLKTKPQPNPKTKPATRVVPAETDSNEPVQELPEFICAKSKLKYGKADVSQFVKELTRKNTMDLYSCDSAWLKRVIIEYGTVFGAITSDWFFEMLITLDHDGTERMKAAQDISLALSELLKNGYLIEYELPPKGESVYFLSPLTEACLKKKAARDIEWGTEIPSEPLFVGTDKISVQTINRFLLNNELYACFNRYCHNNEVEFLPGFERILGMPIETTSDFSGLIIYDKVNVRIKGKETSCFIENGCTSVLDPADVLVVDRKYEASSSKHKIYYLDDLDTNKVKETAKKEKANLPNKTPKTKIAVPKPDRLDTSAVSNPISGLLKQKQGDKKLPASGAVKNKDHSPEPKKPEKAEPVPVTPQPIEPGQAKPDLEGLVSVTPETNVPVKQDPGKETTGTTDAGTIAELPKTKCFEIDDLVKLLDGNETPSDEDFYQIILSLLSGQNATVLSSDSCVVQALLMAKAAAGNSNNTKCKRLYEQLLLATKLPLDSLHYTSEWLEDVYSDENGILKSARLASYIHALVHPDRPYDFSLMSKCNNILQNYEEEFSSFLELKQLFSELTLIGNTLPSGFSDSVLAHLGDAATKDKYVEDLKKSATDFLQTPQGKTGIRQLSKFYELSMGNNSDIYQALTTVAGNQIDDLDIVKACLKDYCEENKGTFSISQDMVDAKIDEFWSKVTGKDYYILDFRARSRADNRFKERIQLMKDWAEYADSVSGEGLDINKVRKMRSKIVKAATAAKEALTGSSDAEKNLLAWVVNSLLKFFNKGKEKDIRAFTELLHTGVISLDDNGIPVIDDNWHQIRYYEPWRLVLRHIISLKSEENRALDKVKFNIFDSSSPIYDNLQQLKMIGKYIGNEEDVRSASNENSINVARRSADDRLKKFNNTLELSFTYGRISEDEKETILGSAKQFKPHFYRTLDFGIWGQFLDALYKRINEASKVRKAELRNQLQARFDRIANNEDSYDKEPPAILTTARRLLEEENNFAVTEEYINQFDSGNVETTTEALEASLYDPDSFAEFLDDRVFKSIYSECLKNKREAALSSFAIKYCENHYPEGWDSQYKKSCKKLINNWPKKLEKDKKADKIDIQVANVFGALGFMVKSVAQNKKYREEVFELTATPADKSLPDYPHPIARFGTQNNSPINVVVFRDGVDVKQLTDTMTRLNLGELTVVLINGCIDLGKRRQIAEEFHGTSRQNSFIFIDWVLAIFLALHQDSERLPVLLKCTLPFTTYQPFLCGGGSTADEMFCGRTVELASLINPNGACVVYGGRQLGKTALLERTASRCSKTQNKAYAVYSNINNCKSEKELVKKLSTDIATNTYLPKLKTDSLQAFCNDILSLFNSNRIVSMHLLMDEADDFLKSIADDNYIALQPLIDLKRVTKNNFKFVLAGLHNVCRAKNATKNNGVFGQLGEPLCIKPLSPTDALQLLSRPLRYLGFKITRYPHLETILTQTNYYPGILQFFGYKLVENLSVNYSKYYRAANGNPPFTLQDDLLGELISSSDLNRSIAEKFRLSLELDERYFMIARCIALLHYDQDEKKLNWMGYKVEDIIETAKEFDIQCLANEDQDDYILLLDEMVDMGILSRPDSKHYRLRRSSFVQLIGPNYDAVFEEIDKENRRTAK